MCFHNIWSAGWWRSVKSWPADRNTVEYYCNPVAWLGSKWALWPNNWSSCASDGCTECFEFYASVVVYVGYIVNVRYSGQLWLEWFELLGWKWWHTGTVMQPVYYFFVFFAFYVQMLSFSWWSITVYVHVNIEWWKSFMLFSALNLTAELMLCTFKCRMDKKIYWESIVLFRIRLIVNSTFCALIW